MATKETTPSPTKRTSTPAKPKSQPETPEKTTAADIAENAGADVSTMHVSGSDDAPEATESEGNGNGVERTISDKSAAKLGREYVEEAKDDPTQGPGAVYFGRRQAWAAEGLTNAEMNELERKEKRIHP